MHMMSAPRLVRLSAIDLGDIAPEEPLPAEFRIFRAGINDTEKGPYDFDANAAQSVMRNARLWDVDICVDLEHRASDEAAIALSDTATDAMAWFRLTLRDGELWAVNVRWTPEGERRLRAKLQRYISPTFNYDEKGRPIELYNVALTSIPAMRGAQPLVAAAKRLPASPAVSRMAAPTRRRRCSMDPALVQKAIDALIAGDAEAALDILKQLVSAAAGAAPAPDPDAAAGAPAVPPEEMAAQAALARAACDLTGHPSAGEALVALHAVFSERAERVARDRAEAEARDLSSRRELVGDLVRLGRELPGTAWADPEARTPAKRLLDEPLADLRARVAAYKAAAPAQPRENLSAVSVGSDDELTESEQRIMAGLPEGKRAEYKVARLARRAR